MINLPLLSPLEFSTSLSKAELHNYRKKAAVKAAFLILH